MIVEEFTVKGTGRYEELQNFLEAHSTEAALRYPSTYHATTDCYDVSIRYSMTSALQLNQLHSKWKVEDEKQVVQKPANPFQYLFSKFIFSSS